MESIPAKFRPVEVNILAYRFTLLLNFLTIAFFNLVWLLFINNQNKSVICWYCENTFESKYVHFLSEIIGKMGEFIYWREGKY